MPALVDPRSPDHGVEHQQGHAQVGSRRTTTSRGVRACVAIRTTGAIGRKAKHRSDCHDHSCHVGPLPANGERDGWHCDAAEQRCGWHSGLLGSEGEPQPLTINMCGEHQVGRRLIERVARSGKSEEQAELPDVPCQHRNGEHRHDRCRQADAESSGVGRVARQTRPIGADKTAATPNDEPIARPTCVAVSPMSSRSWTPSAPVKKMGNALHIVPIATTGQIRDALSTGPTYRPPRNDSRFTRPRQRPLR